MQQLYRLMELSVMYYFKNTSTEKSIQKQTQIEL